MLKFRQFCRLREAAQKEKTAKADVDRKDRIAKKLVKSAQPHAKLR